MKKRLFVFTFAALCACLALVAVPKAHSQGASDAQKQKLQALAKQLNLTPRQKLQLTPILEAEAPKVAAIKNNASLGNFQKLEQLKALHEQTNPQVKAILTPQQYEQLQGIRQEEVKQFMEKKQGTP